MVGWIDVSELTVTAVEASDGAACTTSAPTPFANGMAVQIKCVYATPPTLPVDDHYAHPWWTPGQPDDPYAPTVVVHVRAAMYVQGETAYPTFNAFYNGDNPDIFRGGDGPSVHIPNLHTFLRADIGAPAMLQLGQTGTVGVTAINSGDGLDDLAGTLTLSGQASDTALQITDASIEGAPCQITHGVTDSYTCSLDDVHLSAFGRLATAELHVRAAQPSAGSVVNAHASFSTAVNDDWYAPTASIIIPDPNQPPTDQPPTDTPPTDQPPVTPVTPSVNPPRRPGQLTVKAPKTLAASKDGKVKLTAGCKGEGGCGPDTLTFTGKAGKVKLSGRAKLAALAANRTVPVTLRLPTKPLAALRNAHARTLRLTIKGVGRPVTISVKLTR
jgi:hypothetical protein